MSRTVSKRYAQALYEIGDEAGKSDQIFEDLNAIKRLIKASHEFRDFLSDPTIGAKKRKEIIIRTLKGKVNQLTFTFIKFLDQKSRLALLEEICAAFDNNYSEAHDILKIDIVASSDLNADVLKNLTGTIGRRFKKSVKPEVYTDRSMIGGIKIKSANLIYDYSIKTQLEDFRKRLMKA